MYNIWQIIYMIHQTQLIILLDVQYLANYLHDPSIFVLFKDMQTN